MLFTHGINVIKLIISSNKYQRKKIQNDNSKIIEKLRHNT